MFAISKALQYLFPSAFCWSELARPWGRIKATLRRVYLGWTNVSEQLGVWVSNGEAVAMVQRYFRGGVVLFAHHGPSLSPPLRVSHRQIGQVGAEAKARRGGKRRFEDASGFLLWEYLKFDRQFLPDSSRQGLDWAAGAPGPCEGGRWETQSLSGDVQMAPTWPLVPLPTPSACRMSLPIFRFIRVIWHPKLLLKLLIFKAAFPIPLPCYCSHLILNFIRNSIFSLLPPCVTTCLFLSIFLI